jgi:hypothetical protein
VDAVNRHWQVFRALVLARPLIVVLLGLFYVVAGFLLVSIDDEKKAFAFILLLAIPTGGFFAMATERLIQYAGAGGSLGIPGNAAGLRSGQIDLLILLVAVPAALAALESRDPAVAVLLCVPAAMGVLIALYPRWVFVGWITITVGGRFFLSSDYPIPGFSNPLIRMILMAASAWILYRWLSLGVRVESAARDALGPLADAKHERSAALRGEPVEVESARLVAFREATDAALASILSGISDSRITSRAFSAAFAIDLRPKWPAILKGVVIGWVILAIIHTLPRHGMEWPLYVGLTGFAGVNLYARLGALRQAWEARGGEEALLFLTPRWPGEGQLKLLFVEVMLQSQIGTWLAWSLLILPAFSLGWVDETYLTISVVALLAGSCGAVGSLLFSLSGRESKEISALTVMTLLTCAAGVAVYVWGSEFLSYPRVIGLCLILGPVLAAVVRFATRPLQFPVQRIAKT